MTPYFFTFAMLAFFSITHFTKELKRYKLLFYIFAVGFLILFAGLKAPHVADDYSNYVERFLNTPHIGYWLTGDYAYSYRDSYNEPAFAGLGAFIRVFTAEYIIMFIAVAFLSVGLASYNYYKYAPYVFLTLLLFYVHTYFYRDMTQIRSAVAAAIGLFLIAQLHHKEYKKAFFTILLAGTFHMASLSLFFVYMMSFIKVTRKRILIGLFIALLLGLIGISKFVLIVLPDLGLVTNIIMNYSTDNRYVDSTSLFDVTNIKNLFIISFVLLFWKKLERKVPYFHTLVLFMFLATAWRIAFSDFGIFAARIATFFGIVEVLLIPAFILIFRQKIFVAFLIIIYAFTVLYLNMQKMLNPYELGISLF